MMVLDTPEQIEAYRLLAIKNALKLETLTDMYHSRVSVMKVAAKLCGSKHRTKKAVLADYIVWMDKQLGG